MEQRSFHVRQVGHTRLIQKCRSVAASMKPYIRMKYLTRALECSELRALQKAELHPSAAGSSRRSRNMTNPRGNLAAVCSRRRFSCWGVMEFKGTSGCPRRSFQGRHSLFGLLGIDTCDASLHAQRCYTGRRCRLRFCVMGRLIQLRQPTGDVLASHADRSSI